MRSSRKRQIICICVIEVIIMMAMFVLLIYQYKNSNVIETSLADWKSGYVNNYSEDGWYINESFFEGNENITLPIEFIFGPGIELPKGTYTVNIQYIAESDQTFRAGDNDFIKSADAILSKNNTSVRYHITATEDIESFNISIFYNGKGMLGIQDISIREDTAGAKRNLVRVLALLIFFDLCLLLSTRSGEEKKTFWILAGIVMLSSLPAMQNSIYNSMDGDLMFHLMRIESLSYEIRSGNIPARIASLWMDGYGYPASIYYGDLFIYIPAVLRLANFSITSCYIIYVFIINAGTTVFSYIAFKRIFKNKNVAFLGSLVYVTSAYRLANIYMRSAVGEYSAMMFLPVIALAVYFIYTKDASVWKDYKKYALVLALGMTGLIESHVLSTELVVIVLILICMILWKKTFRPNTIKVYLLAVFETLLLNMWFIVPFLDYMINVSTKIDYVDPSIYPLKGVSIAGLFSFFPYSNGYTTMLFTPGIVLMAGLIASICYIYQNRENTDKELQFYTIFSVLALFMASSFFPWKHLVNNYPFFKILAMVQFPFRYIAIACIFLSLLLGKLINLFSEKNADDVRKIYYLISGACIIFMLYFNSFGTRYLNASCFNDTPELNTSAVIGGEYMRTADGHQAHEEDITGKIAANDMQEVSVLSRNGTEMILYCRAGDKMGTVEVPIFNYKGYHVFDENGTEYDIHDGENYVIGFSLPAGYDGNIIVKFVEPWYWRIAEVISFLFVFVRLLRLGIYYSRQRK